MAESVPSGPQRQTSAAGISLETGAAPGSRSSADGPEGDETDPSLRFEPLAATGVAAELDTALIGRDPHLLSRALLEETATADPRDATAIPADAADDLREVRCVVVTAGEWGGSLPLLLTVYLDRSVDRDVLDAVSDLASVLAEAVALVEYCTGQETRAEQMRQMAEYRRVVEQAKGLVMAAVGTDAPAAFAVLSRASQHFNVRLRHLAVALVEHVGGGCAEHPQEAEARVEPSGADRRVAAQVWQALQAPARGEGPGAMRVAEEAWRG